MHFLNHQWGWTHFHDFSHLFFSEFPTYIFIHSFPTGSLFYVLFICMSCLFLCDFLPITFRHREVFPIAKSGRLAFLFFKFLLMLFKSNFIIQFEVEIKLLYLTSCSFSQQNLLLNISFHHLFLNWLYATFTIPTYSCILMASLYTYFILCEFLCYILTY